MAGVPDKIYPPEGPQRPEFYQMYEKLGEGSYGKVYRVSSSNTNQQFALKIIHLTKDIAKDEREKLNILREICILSSIVHNNVIKYYDSWQTTDYVYIVTEYYNNLDLLTFVKRKGTPSEPQLIEWIRQLASALKHLQERNILHRNVTPKNVMVSGDQTLKLGDFGTAKQLPSGDVTETVIGSPYYMCPEMIRQEPYSEKADIWGLGCLCYALMTGCVLHEGQTFESLKISARTGTNLDKLRNSKIWSDDLKVLAIQMLSQEPTDRPTVESILTSCVVSENTFRASSSVTQPAVAERARNQNVDECDSSRPFPITHEIRNKEDMGVKNRQKKEKRNVPTKPVAPKRSESHTEHLARFPDMFSGTHDLASTCPANMRFQTSVKNTKPLESEVGRQSGEVERRVHTAERRVEESALRRCEGEGRRGEDHVEQEQEYQSIDLCEFKIQQWLCRNLGEHVYKAGLGCLLEPDEAEAIKLLKNAIGEDNFNSYFYYFLILLSIHNHSDIIKNTLRAMSGHL